MIRGKRVTLRPFTIEDIPALVRWHDDGEVMQYWGERQPLVYASTIEEEFKPGGRYTKHSDRGELCVCDEEMRPIGLLGYKGPSGRDRHAELLVLIGERGALNKGYGPESLVVLLNWLFNNQNAHRVWLTVQANNPRAIRAYEKVGFVREGVMRDHYFREGSWHDEVIFGILATEFNAVYTPELTNWVVTGDIPGSANQ